MLTKYFLEFAIFLIGQVLSLVSSAIPGWSELSTLSSAINMLFGVSTQVSNFFYFVFGDFFYTAVGMVSILLPFKFIVCPLLSFIRKVFVWGG